MATSQGESQNKIEIYTYFTKPGDSVQLYSGDRIWAKVTMTLETAGPVAIGNKSSITPVLSGKGELLDTGKPKSINVGRSNRIYIASTSVNRVKVEIEPLPWLEQITGQIDRIRASIAATAESLISLPGVLDGIAKRLLR